MPPSLLGGYHLKPNIPDRASKSQQPKGNRVQLERCQPLPHGALRAIRMKATALLASSWLHNCPCRDQAKMWEGHSPLLAEPAGAMIPLRWSHSPEQCFKMQYGLLFPWREKSANGKILCTKQHKLTMKLLISKRNGSIIDA